MPTHLASAFSELPCWYMLVAVGVSIYHGYRGFVVQRVTVQAQKHELETQARASGGIPNWHWSRLDTIFVRYVYDTLFYFFCSLAGFVALWLAAGIYNASPTAHDIPTGTSALLVFLFLLGLLGIVGQLPHVIQLGKISK